MMHWWNFPARFHPSLKVKGLKLRYFFKQALKDFLPAKTIAKTKHGFGLPFGLWLRDHKPLADLAHDSLTAFERRRIVKPSYIQRAHPTARDNTRHLFRDHDLGHHDAGTLAEREEAIGARGTLKNTVVRLGHSARSSNTCGPDT